MKKFIWLVAFTVLLQACKDSQNIPIANFTLTGSIKGLKKGTLYLKKIKDSAFTTLDSIILYDTSQFTLKTSLEQPEVLYIYLDKLDNSEFDDFLPFFAEPDGTVTINTQLQRFRENAKISGTKNQDKLNEYRRVKERFNTENLRLMNVNYEAQKQNDTKKLAQTKKAFKSNALRQYLYTVNFALNNKDLEVAPYLILSEIPDASIKYLDTVANALNSKIQQSKYGKELLEHIKIQKKAQERINK